VSLGSFTPILIMLALATAFAVLSMLVSAFMAPHRPTRAKYAAYESGIEPGRLPKGERYPVKFYLTAMLFVVFDVEVIFLYPWAVVFRQLALFGLIAADWSGISGWDWERAGEAARRHPRHHCREAGQLGP
jgi:NADH-quinone oxidoreductase subunit A